MTRDNKHPNIQIDATNLNYCSDIMRAISHPLRLKILSFIDNEKKTNVNKIYNTLKLEQSITSQHLKILRDNELVISEREGKYIFYRINYEKIIHVNTVINQFYQK
ncbi:MAG: transcriptional regulator [Chitinophagaceae bacterium]|nr:MAG: transcriptional regulator [Chitinophagaceae bacterium]